MKRPLQTGDRVRVYGNAGNPPFIGVVDSFLESGLVIRLDKIFRCKNGWFMEKGHYYPIHPKQVRRLVPKKKLGPIDSLVANQVYDVLNKRGLIPKESTPPMGATTPKQGRRFWVDPYPNGPYEEPHTQHDASSVRLNHWIECVEVLKPEETR